MGAVYQGAYYSRTFTLYQTDGVTPVNVTGWTLQAQIRRQIADVTLLLNMTSASGGIIVLNGATGRVSFVLTSAQTLALPTGRLRFDVLRTDAAPGPLWLFGGTVPIKQPVTRNG